MPRRRSVLIAAGVALATAATVTVVALSSGNPNPSLAASGTSTVDEFLDWDGRELIDHLEATPRAERREDLFASVRSNELQLTGLDDGSEAVLPLPDDLFYFSFAPYVDQTHDCAFHSLTTCVGEMQNVDVHVLVVTDDGETLVDETMTTSDAGWIGLWLPADVAGTITVTDGDLTATGPLATGASDKTCDSTLQLT